MHFSCISAGLSALLQCCISLERCSRSLKRCSISLAADLSMQQISQEMQHFSGSRSLYAAEMLRISGENCSNFQAYLLNSESFGCRPFIWSSRDAEEMQKRCRNRRKAIRERCASLQNSVYRRDAGDLCCRFAGEMQQILDITAVISSLCISAAAVLSRCSRSLAASRDLLLHLCRERCRRSLDAVLQVSPCRTGCALTNIIRF